MFNKSNLYARPLAAKLMWGRLSSPRPYAVVIAREISVYFEAENEQ
jgi:hypothetical protein